MSEGFVDRTMEWPWYIFVPVWLVVMIGAALLLGSGAAENLP